MAIVDKNNDFFFSGLSGRIGDFVVRQMNGQSIISKRPKRSGKLSEAQLQNKRRFGMALIYARLQMLNPEIKALYQNGVTDKKRSAHTVALTDYLNAPQINSIDLGGYNGGIGHSIDIEAVDDFKVVEVEVIIESAEGELIERGDARLARSSNKIWSYLTTAANRVPAGSKIRVSATDFAGNMTLKSLAISRR